MDRLLIDCNILIDWLKDRLPYSEPAGRLLAMVESKNVKGYISPLTLSNTYYILRKHSNKRIADQFLKDVKDLFNIVDITKEITLSAIKNRYKDFEDDLHYQTAIKNRIDYIITRNQSDFLNDRIQVVTAEEYLELKR